MKQIHNTVIVSLHENKAINGSLFYALEYCMCLNDHTPNSSRLIIHCPSFRIEDTKEDILQSFSDKYYQFDCEIIFTDSRTEVMKYGYKSDCLLFVDIYSYKMFSYINVQKFVYSNEFYLRDWQKLDFNTQNNSLFYGYYDYQYHSRGCQTPLKIYFKYFKDIERNKGNTDYIHLTDPNISPYHSLNMTEMDSIIKKPNGIIRNLFAKISKIVYYQNSDVIDKNNRTLLEAQHYGIPVTYSYEERHTDNINRLKSRKIYNFALSVKDRLIKDIMNYEII